MRDIFRVDPDTACNTHDLLECTCNGIRSDNSLATIDTNRSNMEEEDPGDSEPEKGFMAASQVKPETFNKMDKAVSVTSPKYRQPITTGL